MDPSFESTGACVTDPRRSPERSHRLGAARATALHGG